MKVCGYAGVKINEKYVLINLYNMILSAFFNNVINFDASTLCNGVENSVNKKQ